MLTFGMAMLTSSAFLSQQAFGGAFIGPCFSNADCDDANQCTDDICDLNTNICSNPNDPGGTPCSDSDACTDPDTCQSGVCTGGPNLCVSGTPLPIDTTAVLVAGTQTTTSWMIPVIVAGIGIAVVLARKFSKYQPIWKSHIWKYETVKSVNKIDSYFYVWHVWGR